MKTDETNNKITDEKAERRIKGYIPVVAQVRVYF